jgi:hypothetical protein
VRLVKYHEKKVVQLVRTTNKLLLIIGKGLIFLPPSSNRLPLWSQQDAGVLSEAEAKKIPKARLLLFLDSEAWEQLRL